jgi:hypothetical protein
LVGFQKKNQNIPVDIGISYLLCKIQSQTECQTARKDVLGIDSSSHAVSIRSSNAESPKRGLQRLWKRLDERYGSPEMAEASFGYATLLRSM